jgi:all-beta uncharacterized protein/BACON domain-containing protein
VCGAVVCLLAAPAALHAQTVIDPTIAEFTPSPDHNATLPTGGPVVNSYELEFYIVGAGSPFQVASLGKPAPGTNGLIRITLASVLTAFPSPGINYSAAVAAIGSGGIGRSLPSNTFSFSAACTYTVSPTSATIAAAGATASVTVSTSTGCTWTAASGASWLNITSGSSGNGNGTVNYTIAANTGSSPRTDTLLVAGQLVTITQAGACGFGVNPTTATSAAAGGTGTIAVTGSAGCSWSAGSNDPWITVTGGTSGSGNGTVAYSVAANSATASRTGTLTVAGQPVTIMQAGVCGFAVNPTTATSPVGGGTATIAVTASAGCAWTAASNSPWMTITGGSPGSGTGTVTYSVATNPATTSRLGSLTIAGQVVTVRQDGSCSYAVAPTSNSVGSLGGNFNAAVTTPTGCAWIASTASPWIVILSSGTRTGSGTLPFYVWSNTTTTPRTGALTVAGQVITVTQAAPCTYSVSPPSASVAGTGASATVSVTTGAGCLWTATSNTSWITITAGSSGNGSGTVAYTVPPNPGTTMRTGTMTVASRIVPVTQLVPNTPLPPPTPTNIRIIR